MSLLICRWLLALGLSSTILGSQACSAAQDATVPPQIDKWTEYSNHIGPDDSLSISGQQLVFPHIGSFTLVFDRHFNETDDDSGGDLYKISGRVISPDKDHVEEAALGCGAHPGVGYVLLSEKVDSVLHKTLLKFSPVPGQDAPSMDGRSPDACLTSMWVSR
ncbi:MAG: hypothetical protein ACRYG8_52930 [Janthinobacterium lividum]